MPFSNLLKSERQCFCFQVLKQYFLFSFSDHWCSSFIQLWGGFNTENKKVRSSPLATSRCGFPRYSNHNSEASSKFSAQPRGTFNRLTETHTQKSGRESHDCCHRVTVSTRHRQWPDCAAHANTRKRKICKIVVVTGPESLLGCETSRIHTKPFSFLVCPYWPVRDGNLSLSSSSLYTAVNCSLRNFQHSFISKIAFTLKQLYAIIYTWSEAFTAFNNSTESCYFMTSCRLVARYQSFFQASVAKIQICHEYFFPLGQQSHS